MTSRRAIKHMNSVEDGLTHPAQIRNAKHGHKRTSENTSVNRSDVKPFSNSSRATCDSLLLSTPYGRHGSTQQGKLPQHRHPNRLPQHRNQSKLPQHRNQSCLPVLYEALCKILLPWPSRSQQRPQNRTARAIRCDCTHIQAGDCAQASNNNLKSHSSETGEMV